MKALRQKNTVQNLSSEVHLARILLAKAESKLTTAKEQARLARRRRKEAKQSCRRAKKQARQAKKQVNEAKLALAEAEGKLAKTNQRPVKRKTPRKPAKKVVVAQSQKKPGTPVPIPSRKPVGKKQPTVKRAKSKPKTVPGGKAAKEIAKSVEEIFNEEIQPETPSEAGRTESVTPSDLDSAASKPIVTE